MTFLERLLRHPVGLPTNLISGWWLLFGPTYDVSYDVANFSSPGLSPFPPGWYLIIYYWATRIGAFWLIKKRYANESLSWSKTWKRWSVVPILFIISHTMYYYHLPLYSRLLVNLPFMTQALHEAQKLPPESIIPNQSIGLLSAHRIRTFQGGMRFLAGICESGRCSSYRYGFAYCGTGMPPQYSQTCDRYYRLLGNWYLWTYDG